MAWVKLDDEWFQNPKVLAIGKDGRAMWLAAACWVAKHRLEAGRLDVSALPMLAGAAGVTKVKDAEKAIVSAGLWHSEGAQCSSPQCPAFEAPVPSGTYALHDWMEYQGDAIRARAKAKKGASARWSDRPEAMPEDMPGHMPEHSPSNALPQPLPHVSTYQHSSSVSETPPGIAAAAAEVVDPEVAQCIDLALEVRKRQSQGEIRNPSRWAKTVRRNLTAEHGADIAAALTAGQDPTGAVAMALGIPRTEVVAARMSGGYL